MLRLWNLDLVRERTYGGDDMEGKTKWRAWLVAGLVAVALGPAIGAQEAVRCSAEWRVEETTHLCAIRCPEGGAVCDVGRCRCAHGEPDLGAHLELRARPNGAKDGLYWVELTVRDEQERVVTSPRVLLPAGERGIIQSVDRLGESVLFIAVEVQPEHSVAEYAVTAWPADGEPAVIAEGKVPVAAAVE